MYEDIGRKIQRLAQILGWIMLIGGAIAWISYLADGDYEHRNNWIGWVCLVGGLLSYVSSWFIYGFGQLVDDVNALRYERSKVELEKSDITAKETLETLAGKGWKCTCGKTNPSYTTSCSCGVNKRDIH